MRRRLILAMRRRLILGLAAASLSLAISLGVAELGLRGLLFSDGEAGAFLRDPKRFADAFADDDYWKLYRRWTPTYPPPKKPHPLLGWVWKVDAKWRHQDDGELRGRRPVLLYGDSYANGVPPARLFQEILVDDEVFSRDHYLLNYGVGGYGVDQILLLMRETVDAYDDPLVVFSLMTLDLDRSVLSVRVGQKPFFELVDGRRELRGLPIEPDPADYYAAHPPEIRSYLWAMLAHSSIVPESVGALLRGEAASREHKRELNRAILASAAEELRRRELDFVFLVFHPAQELRAPSWRSAWLAETLDELGVPHISTRRLLEASVPDTPIPELVDPSNGHPTTLYNEVVAEAIADWASSAPGRVRRP